MKLNKIVFEIILLMLFISSCGNKSKTPEETTIPTYPTVELHEQNVELLSVYPATIRGQEDIEIRPRIDGFIEAIYVDEGSKVKRGQTLFRINSPQADQQLITAQAALVNAEAQVNTAKLNVDRMSALVEKDIIGVVQFKTVENAYQSALAAQRQAEAALKNAEATVGWTSVSSPVDGVVGSIPYRLGSLVNSTNVLTTVANTANVFAYFSLNEKELGAFLNNLEGNTQNEKIKNIPEVTLTLANGSIYPEKGRIETITGTVDVATGSATLRAEFPNHNGILRSGTSGRISIPRILENVLLVPQKATFAQQDKTLIYVVQADSVAQRLISVIPTPDGRNYAVTEGLKTGERIVTDGVATLNNGKKINYTNDQTID